LSFLQLYNIIFFFVVVFQQTSVERDRFDGYRFVYDNRKWVLVHTFVLVAAKDDISHTYFLTI